jgi:hypothetical protein
VNALVTGTRSGQSALPRSGSESRGLWCAHELRPGGAVQDIMIRIETDDFEAWKTQHYLHAQNRLSYGITDGPAYQDMDNPNAALFHIKTDDMDRAMEWFKSDTFKEASRLAKVSGRTFYLAQPQTR